MLTYTLCNITKLKKVQRQSARFVLNDYSKYSSVSIMLNTLGWSTLESRRNLLTLTLLYKILHNHVYIPSNYLITSQASTHHARSQPRFTATICQN